MNITKEDLYHQPKNGMIDLALQKQKERDKINADIESFLAKGGKVTVLKNGESSDYNPIRKEKYNNSLKAHNYSGLKTL